MADCCSHPTAGSIPQAAHVRPHVRFIMVGPYRASRILARNAAQKVLCTTTSEDALISTHMGRFAISLSVITYYPNAQRGYRTWTQEETLQRRA